MSVGTITEYKTIYRPALAQISSTNSASVCSDSTITFALNAVNDFLSRFTGRSFDSNEFIESYSGFDSGVLFLRNTPVSAITSITAVYNDGTTDVLDSSCYRFAPETGEVRLLGATPRAGAIDSFGTLEEPTFGIFPNFKEGFLNYTVDYAGGYDTSGTSITGFSVPYDLLFAVYSSMDDILGSIGVRGAGETDSKDMYSRWAERFLPYRHMGSVLSDAQNVIAGGRAGGIT